MVREIIHCQVGQCGNQIGNAFWNTMRQEHLLDESGVFGGDAANPEDAVKTQQIGVYFKEAGTTRYVPRAALIDLEPGTSEVIKASPIGPMFKPDNFVFGASGAGNNWAKGHYTEGAEVIDEVLDVVRKEAEGCDCPQGFQITHSLGGGTGSGLGTLLLLKIRDAFPRLHFFLIAQAPLFSPDNASHVSLNVKEVNDQCWSARNFLANVAPEDGKYLAASLMFRGNLSSEEVDDQMAQTQSKLTDDFVSWIPNNIKSSIVTVPPTDTPISATFVANTTALKGIFQRIATQFAKMYKRKAFLHWYSGEGMDEMEFQESDQNVRDLVTEYQDKQDALVDADVNCGGHDDDEYGDDADGYDDDEF